jgi:hypothetical protein
MTLAVRRLKLYIINDHMMHGMRARASYRESTTFPTSDIGHANPIYTGSCFGHVVNIGNVAVMGHITRIAAVESATAIWEYDPALPDNRVLGGSLDVIAAIRTIAIKVSCDHLDSTYSK